MNIVKAAAEGLKELQSPRGSCYSAAALSVAKIYGWKEKLVMADAKTLRITQVKSSRSVISTIRVVTLKALGLGKIGRTVEQVDNPGRSWHDLQGKAPCRG